jgi:hypothetical protein
MLVALDELNVKGEQSTCIFQQELYMHISFLCHLTLHLKCATHSDSILNCFLVEVHMNIHLVFGEECFSVAQNIHFVSLGGDCLSIL